MDRDDLNRLIREMYPFPIAHTYKRTAGLLDDDAHKLKCILETAESSIQFLALTALAQLRQDVRQSRPPGQAGLDVLLTQNLRAPSFGKWIGILRDVMKGYRDRQGQLVIPELYSFCFQPPTGQKLRMQPIHRRVIDPLVQMRNDFHHGKLADHEVQQKVAEALPMLHELLETLSFFSRYQFSFVQRITASRTLEETIHYTHDLIDISGCFSTFDRGRWESEVFLESGVVVLLQSKEGRHLVLNPFMTLADQIPVRGILDVCLLNQIDKGKALYLSTQFGKKLPTDAPDWSDGPSHQELLGEFLDSLRLIKEHGQPIEIDWSEGIPPDEVPSPYSTAEVFKKRYGVVEAARIHGNPYKFLDYYNPEDHELFFGRDQEIRSLQQKFHAARLLVLHGESGTGKTSLIRAGLIPGLSPESYVPVYVRALREPLLEIKREIIRQLNRDERHQNLSLPEFLYRETELLSRTVVIVLDQFEEFFLRFPEEVRKGFEREIAACLEMAHLDVKFLISLRDDYFALLSEFEDLIPQIFTHHYQLLHLTQAQALEAAVQPARRMGIEIDEPLMRNIVLPQLVEKNVGVEAPLLQIVCDALYQNAQSEGRNQIGPEDYAAIGDVRGALGCYLEDKLRRFGKRQLEAKEVLKALVTAEGTKRASSLEDLTSRLSSAGTRIRIEELRVEYLGKFVNDRLVRVEESVGEARYELSHEYLVRHIGAWIEETEREIKKILELIDRAHEAYKATGLLLEASALDLIAPFEEQLVLAPEKQAFLQESRTRARHKLRVLWMRVAAMLLGMALLIGGVSGFKLLQSYREEVRQRKIAQDFSSKLEESLKEVIKQQTMVETKLIEAQHNLGLVLVEKMDKVSAEKDYNSARLYSLLALSKLDHGKDTARRMHATGSLLTLQDYPSVFSSHPSAGHADSLLCVSFSPDGKVLASASSDRTIQFWDVATGKRLARLEGHTAEVTSISFSADGNTLASGSADKTVRVWDIGAGRELAKLEGHTGPIRGVAFSPVGRIIASASHDQTLRLWDIDSTKELARFEGHTDFVLNVRFSPDGRSLASGSGDNTIRLWDVASGKEIAKLEGHSDLVRSVSFSPDGKRLASGSRDKTLRIWDVTLAKQIAGIEGHMASVNSVSFSPDGRTLASGGADRLLRLWDVASTQELTKHEGHSDLVVSVSFSPDGRKVASGSRDGTVRLWDVTEGKELAKLEGHTDSVLTVCMSPDGMTLASGSADGTVRIWDVRTGVQLLKLEGHADTVRSVCFSPDGKTLLSGSRDGAILTWDARSGKKVSLLAQFTEMVTSVSFSPDGRILASGSRDRTVRLLDADTGRQLAEFNGHTGTVLSVVFSPDGKVLASTGADKTIRLWDVESKREIRQIVGHTDLVYGLTFSTDGKLLASGSWDNTIRLWDAASGKEVAILQGHTDKVNGISFSSDGRTLASGSDDQTIRLWDVSFDKKSPTLKGHTDVVRSVCFSPNGRVLASGSNDGSVRLWDVESGKQLSRLAGPVDLVGAVCYSPDGNTLAVGLHLHSIRLLDLTTGKQKAKLLGHRDRIMAVSFSPDGKLLASGSKDGTIRLWNVSSGEEVARFDGYDPLSKSVSFSPDGRTLASGSDNTSVSLWDVATGKVVANLKGHAMSVLSVSFSPDGKTLASASVDASVNLWDLATNRSIAKLKEHSDAVMSVCFSPDGRLIASGSWDKTICVWDVVSREKLAKLEGHSKMIDSVSFSPDGRSLASGSWDNTVRLWDMSPLSDSRPQDARLVEARRQYNLELEGIELKLVQPEINILARTPAPNWPKHHPFHWLSDAEKGNPEAMVQLGIIYDRDNENEKALHWYRKAADSGSAYGKERHQSLQDWIAGQGHSN